jgi:hypothetical protein
MYNMNSRRFLTIKFTYNNDFRATPSSVRILLLFFLHLPLPSFLHAGCEYEAVFVMIRGVCRSARVCEDLGSARVREGPRGSAVREGPRGSASVRDGPQGSLQAPFKFYSSFHIPLSFEFILYIFFITSKSTFIFVVVINLV